MEQLILHLLGDYVLQTDWMAQHKTKRISVAIIHSALYALPFLLLTHSVMALSVIFATHVISDRYRLARFVVYAKNKATNRTLRWAEVSATGYPRDTPPWLAFMLLMIVDNTMHITINYVALRWL